MSTRETEIPFLDILIRIKGMPLYTDMYYKDTDTDNYIPSDSYHPHHTKANIPHCLARHIYTILGDEEIRNQSFNRLKTFLRAKWYPDNLVKGGICKVQSIPIVSSILPKAKKRRKLTLVVTFIYTHNPNNLQVNREVKHALSTLCSDNKMLDKIKKYQFYYNRNQQKTSSELPSTLAPSRFEKKYCRFNH